MKRFFMFYKCIFSICIILIVLLLMLPRIIGYTPYAIESDSMTPTTPKGTLIYVHTVPEADLQINDIITFHKSSYIVTHRIVGIDAPNRLLTTKGDAIKYNDEEKIPMQNVIGRVEFSFPYVGYALLCLKSTVGIVIGCMLCVMYILSFYLPKLRGGNV